MKIALILYSKTGHTQKVAEQIAAGMAEVAGCTSRIMQADAIDKEYVAECDAVLFGTPTYYANTCWQMSQCIEEYGKGLANKLAGVFATANVVGGGAETALLTLINLLLVRGMLIYSGGESQGQPITHLGLAVVNQIPFEEQQDKMRIYGKRMATKANELFANK